MHVTTPKNSNPVCVFLCKWQLLSIFLSRVAKKRKRKENWLISSYQVKKNKTYTSRNSLGLNYSVLPSVGGQRYRHSIASPTALWNIMQDSNRLRGMYVHVHSPTDDLLQTRIPGTNGTTESLRLGFSLFARNGPCSSFCQHSICSFNVSWPACTAEKNATPTYLK